MIIFHAGIQGDRFLLWGEVPAESAAAPTERRGRKSAAARRTPPLPYDAGIERLSAAITEAVSFPPLSSAKAETVIAWLPTVNHRPQASSPLIAELPEPSGQAELAAWMVTALPLPTTKVIDLLGACVNRETLAPGVIVGPDLAFWQAALRFAGSVVARQSFLPGLDVKGSRPRARWEPIFAGADTQRFARLAHAMPHSCRALTDREAAVPPDTPAAAALSFFLTEVVDELIRSTALPVDRSTVSRLPRKQKPTFESTHDEWLHALRAPDGTMTGEEAELARLAEEVREWQRPVTVQTATPARLCFRLEEPLETAEPTEPIEGSAASRRRGRAEIVPASSADSGAWQVRYLLQAADDPSLIVPAARIWNAKGRLAAVFTRPSFKPREYLLSALGQAAKIDPHVEQSLRAAAPGEYKLDATGAHEFLQERAWALEQAGFGVLLPAWWTRKGTKLKLSARAVVQSPKLRGGGMSLEEIVKFEWEVALGGEKLSLQELETLARLKAPLVKVRGQWVELNAEEIQAALNFWKRGATGKAKVRDIVQMALGAETAAPGGIEFEGVTAAGWIGDLLAQLEGRRDFAELPVPDGFQGTLRPYQVRGFSWLGFLRQYGFSACLADDMGLGKCVSADSLIVVNGILQTAEDIWSRNARDITFDGEGYWADPAEPLLTTSINERTELITQTQIRRLYRQRVCERVRTIKLEDGSGVTITRQHKLLTSRGWTSEFRVGDYVCVPAKLLWDGKPEDPNLVKFLAWQIAEGYESPDRACVKITQKDASVLEKLRQCLFSFSEKYSIKINRPSIRDYSSNRAGDLILHSTEYRRFLEIRGYKWGKLSREKSIPPFVMQADLDSVRLFLRNYFDAEASAVKSMGSVEISTASPLLIQQLSHLLRRFGIWLRISAKQKCATNGTRLLRTYYIGTMGGNAARRFHQEIGFGDPHKQQRLAEICARPNNTNVEGIPASELVAQAVSTTKLPLRHFGMHNPIYLDGSQQFSRASLERVLASFDRILNGDEEQEYRQLKPSRWTTRTLEAYARLDTQLLSVTRQGLRHFLDQEVFYCKIKEIEEVEYDGWVYDFEVEEHHNFVANNILCHNTAQTLAFIQQDWPANNRRPTLVVCPMSVVGNWQKEAARFTPNLPVMIHHGLTRTRGKAFKKAAEKHALVLSSYALLHRDFEFLKEVGWSSVILDEAQNVKNAQTKQAQAARSLPANYRIALTGTPVENNVGDLWSIMEFLNPGLLGTQAEFKRNFFLPIQVNRDPEATERLKRLTGPFILRRLKTDKSIIRDLPEKMEMKVFCTLTKEQASLYAAVVRDAGAALDETKGIQRKGVVLATLSKLKQVCNHPAQFLGDNSSLAGRSGKLARLAEMLEEVSATNDRALVFTQFAEMGTLIQRHLQETFGHEVLFLHGAVPKARRDRMVERFQNGDGDSRIFLLSLKAGGTGLNLTAANHVFHFDRWWNPAVENQATDRAFRIGQRKNVQVHKFLCAGTLEEKIDEMIESKQELALKVVGSGEGWLTELSTPMLKELFALRADAVGE